MIRPWVYFTGPYIECSLVYGDLLDEIPGLPVEVEEDGEQYRVTIYFKEE